MADSNIVLYPSYAHELYHINVYTHMELSSILPCSHAVIVNGQRLSANLHPNPSYAVPDVCTMRGDMRLNGVDSVEPDTTMVRPATMCSDVSLSTSDDDGELSGMDVSLYSQALDSRKKLDHTYETIPA